MKRCLSLLLVASGLLIADRTLPAGEKGEPSALIRRVRQQLFCVLLLDEIEKAGPEVFDVLLSVCDEGRRHSGTGEVARRGTTGTSPFAPVRREGSWFAQLGAVSVTGVQGGEPGTPVVRRARTAVAP